jgi:two-component system response regulator PilR (NtrC family)
MHGTGQAARDAHAASRHAAAQGGPPAAATPGGFHAASAPAGSTAAGPQAEAPRMPPLPVLDILPSNLPEYLAMVEREIIQRALAQTQYNRTQAASLLGISFRQLRYQMQKLNIQEPDS